YLDTDPERGLQLLPMLCGLLAPLLLGWLIQRETKLPPLGLVAAAILAMSPVAVGYSMRVKQFSWDALVVVVVLIFGLSALQKAAAPSWRQILPTAIATLLSYASILVAAPILHISLLRSWVQGRPTLSLALHRALPTLTLDLIWLGYYWFRLRAQSRGDVNFFWRLQGVLPEWTADGLIGYFLSTGQYGFTKAMGNALPFVEPAPGTLLVAISLLVLWIDRSSRWLGAFFSSFYALALSAALFRVYPFGGIRTDIFSYPVTVCLVSLALGIGLNRFAAHRRAGIASMLAGLSLAMFVLQVVRPRPAPTPYPARSDAELVTLLETSRASNEFVLVSRPAHFAVGYYGNLPMRYVGLPRDGFRIKVMDPRWIQLEWNQSELDVPELKSINRMWYLDIDLNGWAGDTNQRLLDWLSLQGFTTTSITEKTNGSLRRLDRMRPAGPPPSE
ncbi:hypothetical protein MK280_12055, partial [Myxococcota bacterium]|nr:hypothetical protein [Myxococcota bacterium]